jgi:hypothetical protein
VTDGGSCRVRLTPVVSNVPWFTTQTRGAGSGRAARVGQIGGGHREIGGWAEQEGTLPLVDGARAHVAHKGQGRRKATSSAGRLAPRTAARKSTDR